MKYWVGVVASIFVALLWAIPLSAMSTEPTQPFPKPSEIIITAYQATGSLIDFVQIYNNGDDVVSLDGWQFSYVLKQGASQLTGPDVTLTGLIEPGHHAIISGGAVGGATFNFIPPVYAGYTVQTLRLTPPTADILLAEQPVTNTSGIAMQRGKTTTGYSSSTTFQALGSNPLYSDALYVLPVTPDLKVVEVLPHAKECAPDDNSLTCGDYIKLRMGEGFSLSKLGDYRIKVGHKGDNDSITNTFSLGYAAISDHYLTIHLRDDGELISLTNSGGYIWLEDKYGMVHYYSTTLQDYADAGSATKVNMSWALDPEDDTWKWALPSPGHDNSFPVSVEAEVVGSSSQYASCGPGRYRSPDTNRCRNIVSTTSTLTPCRSDQYRNPATNRCNNVSTASATLKPCSEGQERNPATNRCRKTSNGSTLTPCQPGQERNPATNRCRKSVSPVSSVASSAASQASDGQNSFSRNVLLGVAGVGVVSYGVFEWRSEITTGFRRIVSALGKK